MVQAHDVCMQLRQAGASFALLLYRSLTPPPPHTHTISFTPVAESGQRDYTIT